MLKHFALIVAIAAVGATAMASELPSYPFVHATGYSMTAVMPDVGEIDFEINVTDPNPEAAVALMEERVAAVRAIMQAQAVPEGDIQVRNVRKGERKDANGLVVGVVLRSTVRVTVRDLSKWALVVQPILNMPNTDSFFTAFDVNDRERITAELMVQALQDARKKAANMAVGVGRKLGDASAISSGQLKNITTAMGLAGSEQLGSRSTAQPSQTGKDFLMIEAQKFQQPVDVIFRLK
jgi:uncharacterized protein YggE